MTKRTHSKSESKDVDYSLKYESLHRPFVHIKLLQLLQSLNNEAVGQGKVPERWRE